MSSYETVTYEEANGVARVPEEWRQPPAGTRREPVELRRDPNRALQAARKRLDETVDRPLVPVGKAGERRDAGDAHVLLVAAKAALEEHSRLALARSGGAAGPVTLVVERPSPGDRGEIGPGSRADSGRHHSGGEQQPRASRQGADQRHGRPPVHRPLFVGNPEG